MAPAFRAHGWMSVVRIKSVRSVFLFLSLAAGVVPACGQTEDPLHEALSRVAREASDFWHAAPTFLARETLKQKVIVTSPRDPSATQSGSDRRAPRAKDREIVSYYGFSAYSPAPEALHEFRCIISIDGKALLDTALAREKLRSVLDSRDDRSKRTLLGEFEILGLGSSAIDFGQLILLFTRSNLDKYAFEVRRAALLGADPATVIGFQQRSGPESLHISDAGKKLLSRLEGELWIRKADFAVLRISLTAVRTENKAEIRDEARVEYMPAQGIVLPASVSYRRFVDGELRGENIYEYSDWQRADAR